MKKPINKLRILKFLKKEETDQKYEETDLKFEESDQKYEEADQFKRFWKSGNGTKIWGNVPIILRIGNPLKNYWEISGKYLIKIKRKWKYNFSKSIK